MPCGAATYQAAVTIRGRAARAVPGGLASQLLSQAPVLLGEVLHLALQADRSHLTEHLFQLALALARKTTEAGSQGWSSLRHVRTSVLHLKTITSGTSTTDWVLTTGHRRELCTFFHLLPFTPPLLGLCSQCLSPSPSSHNLLGFSSGVTSSRIKQEHVPHCSTQR